VVTGRFYNHVVDMQQSNVIQPATAPAAAVTANSKDIAYKMKQLANQLSHGEVAIASDASGVKIRCAHVELSLYPLPICVTHRVEFVLLKRLSLTILYAIREAI